MNLTESAVQVMTKTIHIHIGPHKTGSTAIQETLRTQKHAIDATLGLEVMDQKLIAEIAHSLKRDDKSLAVELLAKLSRRCESARGDCLVSCEDLAGDLPGNAGRRPYVHLWQNINLIRKSLSEYRCVFYFFLRDRKAWLKSAYVQNLEYRTRFTSLEQFLEFLQCELLWDGVIEKSAAKLGDRFVCIPYMENKNFSSVAALFTKISDSTTVSTLKIDVIRVNSMPSDNVIHTMECINKSSASVVAKRNAKKCIIQQKKIALTSADEISFPHWEHHHPQPDWLHPDLTNLWCRVKHRVHAQEQPNLLPHPFADLTVFRTASVVGPDEFPKGGRGNINIQKQILAYRFNGLPETCLLLGLTVSYLRRQTEYTELAAYLFQRLWAEEHQILLGTLPTRWLISAFQTFLDHGANEQQRVVGGSAYFFSNMLKAYEAERAIEGLNADAIYPNVKPVTKNGFAGLDRFNLGGTDLMLNTNALLIELSSKDEIIGRVVQEFLARLKISHTIFSRMDRSRISHQVENPQFENCWSFFEEPR